MSSPIDRLHERTSSAALLWLHGDDEENVIRWIGGDNTNTISLRGIFYPDETRRDEKRGIEHVTMGVLELAGDVTVAENDKWSIDGSVYSVLAVGKVIGGIRSVQLSEVVQTRRRGQRDII